MILKVQANKDIEEIYGSEKCGEAIVAMRSASIGGRCQWSRRSQGPRLSGLCEGFSSLT